MIATPSVRPARPRPATRRLCISAFHLFYIVLTFAVVPLAWFKGGHPERFAAGLLTVAYLVSHLSAPYRIGNVLIGDAVADTILTAIFGYMALKGDRWWPFAITAFLVLTLMVHLSVALQPGLDHRADISARIGLGILIVACPIFGVVERWLAGERPVSEQISMRRRASHSS